MKVVVGLTGASGSILFKRTIDILSSLDYEISVIATENGKKVFAYELDVAFDQFISNFKNVRVTDIDNMFAHEASGSSSFDQMIIVPCSMGTAGNIAHGTSNNLLIRCADVFLKERKNLVLALRETPLSTIHLNNMQILNQSGAILVPQIPSFYNKREELSDLIDDMVYRNLKYLGVELPKEIQW